MEAFKFETTIQENGVIQIPEIAEFAHRPIEIFIVIKEADVKRKQNIEQFLKKWTGFLKGANPDDAKLQYLRRKHA